MRVKDLMSHPVVTVGPQDTVRDAAALLNRHGFTALPVVDDGGDLVGIVTEADVLRERIPADPRSHGAGGTSTVPPAPRTVGEVMTTPAVTVTSGADVAEVASTMLAGRLRAVPVVDPDPADHRLVGILTRRDLMRCIGRDDSTVAADVRHRLEVYGGRDRWTVTADAGRITITDGRSTPADPTDLHVAHVLAAAVPGVTSVTVSTAPD